jgi:sugar lactone lactonase YvrE
MTTKLRLVALTAIFLVVLHALPASGDVLYVSSQASRHILKVNSTGSVSVFASLPPSAAYPSGLAFDATGNLYASDPNRDTIHKITPAGVVTLFKNLPSMSFPTGMTFDTSGNLYVGNSAAHQINRISPAGALSLFATVPVGIGAEGLAFDATSNLYAAGNDQVVKISPAGTVSLFANLPSGSTPFGLAFDDIGNLYVADLLADAIRKITVGGSVSTFATLATNTQPVGLAFDSQGNLYEAGVLGQVHKITPNGAVSLFASDFNESFLHIAMTDDSGQRLALPPATLFGDYNRDGTVDAADYVVWRKGVGTVYNEADYQIWRGSFGESRIGGSGSTASLVNPAVPEPSALLLLALAAPLLCLRRGRVDLI